jgi:hypothetical protein
MDSTQISRVDCEKAGSDDDVPALIESEVSFKEFRNNWARLIQKIYADDYIVDADYPMETCP